MWCYRILSVILNVCLSCCVFGQNYAREDFSYTYPTSYEQWKEALLTGNGTLGIMVFGNPLHETIVFTSRALNFPGNMPSTFAEVPRDTLDLIKQYCATEQFKTANDLAVRTSHWRDGGEGERHPDFLMKIDMNAQGDVNSYRWICNYETGEIAVKWNDGRGDWQRQSFVSRDANVAVFRLLAPSKGELNCAVSLQIDEKMNFPKGMKITQRHESGYLNIRVNYASPMEYGGYEGGIRVKLTGGSSYLRNDTLFIENASEALLFAQTRKYDIGCEEEWNKELIKRELEQLPPRYESLLNKHKKLHSAIYNRVQLDLESFLADRQLSNEELLSKQKQTDKPVLTLWERIFDAGRYHFLSSGNEQTPPDLLGIWTGGCNAGWGGYYHLDANLNLQVSGGNTGDMSEVMEGYFHLSEVWQKDFEINATKLLGCRGMVACGNPLGLSHGLMASINEYYPYHYTTGEEAWLLYPFWEHYLITEDKTFLRNRLFPLLKSMGEFYEDFLKYKDSEGHYIFADSVSPENQPANLKVSLLNNSAFDVSAARFLLTTLVKAYDLLNEEQGLGNRKQRWKKILEDLPPYQLNKDGATKEWGWLGLDESYGHRHSSHLIMVWPYRELSLAGTPDLYKAACKTLELKDRYLYENAGHGLLHSALIATGLHQSASLKNKLLAITPKDFYYNSLSTAHYPNHGTFCTDVCHTVPGILIKMLVSSSEKGIELLPALVEGIDCGSISGIRTRCGVTIEKLSWNSSRNEIRVTLRAFLHKSIRLKAGIDYDREVKLSANKSKKIVFGYK